MEIAATPRRFSFGEAACLLDSPTPLVELSPLTGTALILVDFSEARRIGRDVAARIRERLRELPCPSIALGRPSVRNPLEGGFDVVVRREEDAQRVSDCVCRRPFASATLAQLLRHSEKLGLHDALVAESLVYSMLQSGPEFSQWQAGRGPTERNAATDEGPPVLVTREGSRLDVVCNRSSRHNAYSIEMRDGLVEALEIAVADSSITEVVLSGRGRSFCAGGDLSEFGLRPDPVTAHAVRSARNAARLLAHCAEHVRAEVHGACIGAGAELAAFAAFVVAKPDAFFELPEVGMGLVPGAGGTASIVRRIGRQRTAYMALTGERIDAKTALEWGLIDAISTSSR